MKIRLADYVAAFLVEKGVTDMFSVVGGGAMHLNDAFGHNENIHVTYNHHEQACAIAAESYARLNNRIAPVCVTTGPGGTNALTGVLGGWLDSIPMFIISGQVRYDTTARYGEQFTNGMKLRSVGDQEYDIVRSVEPMTKYAVMIENPNQIRYALEKAWHLATTGRPGPVWIDIPVNFQGSQIETDDLVGYDTDTDVELMDNIAPEVTDDLIDAVIERLKSAKRPVLHAGYGVRLSGAYDIYREVIERLGIPVVTYWNAIDLIEDDNPLYVGRAGNMGDRAGNWAIQNADVILAIGTRISIRQVGYNWQDWAPNAEVIMVDVDRAELLKHTIHVDMPIWADAKDFLHKLNDRISTANIRIVSNQPGNAGHRVNESVNGSYGNYLCHCDKWRGIASDWKRDYPVVTTEQESNSLHVDAANVYAVIKGISSALPDESLTAVSNGACCVVGTQAYRIGKGSRFVVNSAVASMGYGLPAAIGLCIAGGKRDTICLEGDGSIMMNLQELQTIITNKLPIKIFLINNQGYHSIRITQTNLFSEHCKVGIGPESGDLSFPEYSKIATAFGYEYMSIHNNSEIESVVSKVLSYDGPVICEVFTDTSQVWEPKSSAKKLADGSLVSAPLEDMAPFLPRQELDKIMSEAKV